MEFQDGDEDKQMMVTNEGRRIKKGYTVWRVLFGTTTSGR